MQRITLARNAMATRFELVLLGDDPVRLRAAGEEALDEIDRIESQLSLYRHGSEIAVVNARASYGPVRLSPEVFSLVQRASFFSQISSGSFDITVAPLVRCWGFMKGSGARPTDFQIAQARELVGSRHLDVDESQSAIRFKRAGMMLDLGSLGKGYALDAAASVLRDAGVENALLHGGTSTIYGLGQDATGPWKVAIDKPVLPGEEPSEKPAEPAAIVELRDQALSVSAVWGKFFVLDGKTYGHVIDPRTGWPAANALLGAVVVDSAADSDALSTVILLAESSQLHRPVGNDVRSPSSSPEHSNLPHQLKTHFPSIRYLQASLADTQLTWTSSGINLLDPSQTNGPG